MTIILTLKYVNGSLMFCIDVICRGLFMLHIFEDLRIRISFIGQVSLHKQGIWLGKVSLSAYTKYTWQHNTIQNKQNSAVQNKQCKTVQRSKKFKEVT